jgi:hypothetical protein
MHWRGCHGLIVNRRLDSLSRGLVFRLIENTDTSHRANSGGTDQSSKQAWPPPSPTRRHLGPIDGGPRKIHEGEEPLKDSPCLPEQLRCAMSNHQGFSGRQQPPLDPARGRHVPLLLNRLLVKKDKGATGLEAACHRTVQCTRKCQVRQSLSKSTKNAKRQERSLREERRESHGKSTTILTALSKLAHGMEMMFKLARES